MGGNREKAVHLYTSQALFSGSPEKSGTDVHALQRMNSSDSGGNPTFPFVDIFSAMFQNLLDGLAQHVVQIFIFPLRVICNNFPVWQSKLVKCDSIFFKRVELVSYEQEQRRSFSDYSKTNRWSARRGRE